MTPESGQDASQVVLAHSDTLSTVENLDPGLSCLKSPPHTLSSLYRTGLSASSAPATPTTPTGITAVPESKAKKNNPLVDLIETEKLYVEQLTGIIRVSSEQYVGGVHA